MTLCVVCFVTVFSLINYVATVGQFSTDDQSIEIYPGNSSNLYLMLKNTRHIYFKNFTGISIECTYGDQQNYETQNHFDPNNGRFEIITVADFMSTRWECTGYDWNHYKKTEYIFIIKVKAAKKVNVTISGRNVEFKITNLSEEYDGVYEYAFAEGDTIDLICINPHETGQIELKYYDANGSNIFETYPTKDKYLTFRKLARDKNINGSYIECSYITLNAVEQTYTYRIIFTVTTATLKSSGFIVTINDMKLSAMSGDIYKYKYKFVNWVPLRLTCEVKDQNLQNVINNKNIVLTDIIKTPSKYSAVIETNNLDGAIFQCCTASKVRASITFSKDPYRDPFIQGLNASNILYQYNTDNLHWIIHYQYEIFDVLNLTCFTEHDREPKWKYDRVSENNTSTIHIELEKNSRYIMQYFRMNDKSNKNISCESNRTTTKTRYVTIILHPISGFGNSDSVNNPTGDDMHTSLQSIPIEDVPLALSSEGSHLTVPAIIGIVAGVVITAVTVICAFYWWRSRRFIVTKEEAPYRSFNEENYHEYTYIQTEYDKMKNEDSQMKINDLYIGGGLNKSCKTMTTPTENHYTEIDMKRNPDGMSVTYAVPYEVHNINKTETSGNQKL